MFSVEGCESIKMSSSKASGPLSPQFINFVYIPSAILIAGTALVKPAWTPFAVVIAAALGGFQFYQSREYALY